MEYAKLGDELVLFWCAITLGCVAYNHCRLPRCMQSNLCSELIIMAPKSVKFVLSTYS